MHAIMQSQSIQKEIINEKEHKDSHLYIAEFYPSFACISFPLQNRIQIRTYCHPDVADYLFYKFQTIPWKKIIRSAFFADSILFCNYGKNVNSPVLKQNKLWLRNSSSGMGARCVCDAYFGCFLYSSFIFEEIRQTKRQHQRIISKKIKAHFTDTALRFICNRSDSRRLRPCIYRIYAMENNIFICLSWIHRRCADICGCFKHHSRRSSQPVVLHIGAEKGFLKSISFSPDKAFPGNGITVTIAKNIYSLPLLYGRGNFSCDGDK